MAGDETRASVAELLQLGRMGLELGYRKQAESYFDLVLERVPGHPGALLGKAKACTDLHRALELVHTVLRSRPASLEALRLQAQIHQDLETEEAERRIVSVREPAATEAPGPRAYAPPATPRLDEFAPDPLDVLASRQAELRLRSPAQSERAREPVRREIPQERGAFIERLPGLGRGRHGQRRLSLGHVVATLAVGLAVVAVQVFLGPRSETRELVHVPTLEPVAFSESEPSTPLPASSPAPDAGPFAKAESATVLLVVPDPLTGRMSRGSGIVVSPDGLVLTSYHVVANPEQSALANKDGLALVGFIKDVRQAPSDWYIAAVAACDPQRTLAVLRILNTAEGQAIRGRRFQEVSVADSDALALGQPLMGLGYPELGGETLTLTRGSMAGFSLGANGLHLGKTDSEMLPGSSGGAVLDGAGHLVGVITAANTDYRTQGRLSYFVLLNEAQSVINEARRARRPRLDIQWIVEMFPQMAR